MPAGILIYWDENDENDENDEEDDGKKEIKTKQIENECASYPNCMHVVNAFVLFMLLCVFHLHI